MFVVYFISEVVLGFELLLGWEMYGKKKRILLNTVWSSHIHSNCVSLSGKEKKRDPIQRHKGSKGGQTKEKDNPLRKKVTS